MTPPPTLSQLLQQALAEHSGGGSDRAAAICRQILSLDPRHAVAWNLLGVLAHQAGRQDEALQHIGRALQLRPAEADFHANFGRVLLTLGEMPRAEGCFKKAMALNPRCAAALHGLAQLRKKQDRLDDAAKHLGALLTLGPSALIHCEVGNVLSAQGKSAQAHEAYANALRLDPDNPVIYNDMGICLHARHRYIEAGDAFAAAIARAPAYTNAQVNLIGSLLARGRVDDAIAACRSLLSLRPDDAAAHSALLMAMHYLPHERGMLFREHLAWAERHARVAADNAGLFQAHDRDANRRLRIGYVSADLRLHSVAFFFEPILNAHDRTAVEVFCYSDAPRADDVTARLRRRADHWRDVAGRLDEDFCAQVRADRIDILIDLSGHTAGNRLRAFAARLAPVQATYLGYPDTTGLSAIDARLTDAIADPDGDEFHSETLLRLPRCAWCYRPPEICPHPGALPARERGAITFGSFNALAKLSALTIDLWSEVLLAVPASRLMLKSAALSEEATRTSIAAAFASRGVADARLLFRGHEQSLKDHLRSYHEVDIALDTYPYHGTTTTCDALWMGVPVITLAGELHVSRVGASLLHAAGLDEYVIASPERFVYRAIEAAADQPRLAKLRSSLRGTMQKSPLLDGVSLARALEGAYRNLWRKFVGR